MSTSADKTKQTAYLEVFQLIDQSEKFRAKKTNSDEIQSQGEVDGEDFSHNLHRRTNCLLR